MMNNSIRKKPAKIVDKAIRKAPETSRETARETRSNGLLQRIAETRIEGERDGRDAYANLKRLKNRKLPTGAEITIATRLYGEVQNLGKHLKAKGISKAEFCSRCGLNDASESSKELNRLTVAPGSSVEAIRDRRLRRHADKYRLLIDGICKITGQSQSILADKVLMGTPLHPIEQFSTFSETENVLSALQGIVDKIDRECGLYQKFMEIGRLKAAHIRNGGSEHWPLFSVNPDDSALAMFLGADSDIKPTERERAENTIRHEHAKDPRYAFWAFDPISADINWEGNPCFEEILGAVGDPDFFYIPHVRVGIVEFWMPEIVESTQEHERAQRDSLEEWQSESDVAGESRVSLLSSFEIHWDSARQCPTVQSRQPYPNPSGLAWLIIYPRRDHAQLVPMLYSVGEIPVLSPLDIRGLDDLRNARWLDETRCASVFDRIVELIGYREGATTVIEDELRRTAAWLDHNPFFKMRQTETNERDRDTALLHAYVRKLREDL